MPEEYFCTKCRKLIKQNFINSKNHHIKLCRSYKFDRLGMYLCKKCKRIYKNYISNWRHRKSDTEREVRESYDKDLFMINDGRSEYCEYYYLLYGENN